MSETQKSRYFAFLVYPESAPGDWLDQLRATRGDYLVSPMHEPDAESAKPHFHVIYHHSNTVTLACAKSVIPEAVPANGVIQQVSAPRNYQRYLLHMDDPDKQQFPGGESALTVLGCFPVDLSRDFTKSELQQQRSAIFSLIRTNGVTEYGDLLDGLIDSGMTDLFDFAANHTILFRGYLDSIRNSRSV